MQQWNNGITISVRTNDEESGAANQRQCIVISDEVRLQRGGDDNFSGTTRSCCLCSLFRCMIGFLEWLVLFRWYQPDLASYMSQTISSMEKLRTLIERGEAAAYAGGEVITEGDGGENNINVSLLGGSG